MLENNVLMLWRSRPDYARGESHIENFSNEIWSEHHDLRLGQTEEMNRQHITHLVKVRGAYGG